MLVPISWLKDFVDIDVTLDELSAKLVAAGFEIEDVIDTSKDFSGVVSCKIVEMTKHENADKLQVCKVDLGTKTLQIVTAAKNVKVGDIVPVALDGAVLAGDFRIKTTKMRGVLSEGMFCGLEELSIDETDYPGADKEGVLIASATGAISTFGRKRPQNNEY